MREIQIDIHLYMALYNYFEVCVTNILFKVFSSLEKSSLQQI